MAQQLIAALILLLGSRYCAAQRATRQASSDGETYGASRSNVNKMSVHVGQQLPSWCKDREHAYGSWHTLSDDEYSNESPHLRCAFPRGLAGTSAQLPAQRRAARAAKVGNQVSCSDVLQIPKVAMMFLTQGKMPHEALWEQWLASVAGLVPTLCTANALCARGWQALHSLTAACGGKQLSDGSAYDRQLLFSAYIHAAPAHPLRGPESVFFGRDALVQRLDTRWGDHSTVEVTRRLLQAALKDPNNQRFILLSETCVPLYSPRIVYQQLMHEWRSRISACAIPGWDRSIERYNLRMAAGRRPDGRIPVDKWRKHMHWFSLVRAHAELVANDTEVVDTFARDCFTGFDILSLEVDNYRFCIGDEHYVSTLLAVYGLDAETDCLGRLTNAAFSMEDEHPEHPKSYNTSEITPTLFRNLRGVGIEVLAATRFADSAFRRIEDFNATDAIWQIPYADVKQLRSQYFLFARKFPAETAAELLQMLRENDDRGDLLNIFGGFHRSRELADQLYGP